MPNPTKQMYHKLNNYIRSQNNLKKRFDIRSNKRHFTPKSHSDNDKCHGEITNNSIEIIFACGIVFGRTFTSYYNTVQKWKDEGMAILIIILITKNTLIYNTKKKYV